MLYPLLCVSNLFYSDPLSHFIGTIAPNQAKFRQMLQVPLHGCGRLSDCVRKVLFGISLSGKDHPKKFFFYVGKTFY